MIKKLRLWWLNQRNPVVATVELSHGRITKHADGSLQFHDGSYQHMPVLFAAIRNGLLELNDALRELRRQKP